MVEGVKIINDLLLEDLGTIDTIFATADWVEENSRLIRKDVEVISCSAEELSSISSLKTPNEVLAVLDMPEASVPIDEIAITLCLYLDTIRDPGNLGTILRTADWFGIKHVFLSPDSVDVFNPKVIQSSMSSVLRVSTTYIDQKAIIDNASLFVIATALDGQDLHTSSLPDKGLLIMGNESKGINAELQQRADLKLRIPGNHRLGAESLNVAVATGIVLSHLTRKSES